MRLICIVALLALRVVAQPVVSSVQVTPGHGSVLVRAQITNTAGQSLLQLHYGPTTALGYATTNAASAASTPTRTLVEAGLSPSSTYYFRIKVTASTGTTLWSCSPGSSGPGWTCDSASGAGVFTTTALPQNHGEPQLPAEVNTAMPAVNGSTFNVAADCGNLQSMLNACAAADASLVHQVMVPPGAVCRGRFDLPVKSGPGVCVLRSAAPDRELPPEGVRIDPSYASKTPRFILPHSGIGEVPDMMGVLTAGATSGWRLMGLSFELDSPLSHRKIPISSVSSSGIITTSVPHGLDFWQQVYVAGVQGFRGRGPNGSWGVQVLSPSTLGLFSASYNVLGTPDFTCAAAPCHVPGTGYIVQAIGSPIVSATSATPPVITTPKEHGFFNEPWWNIVAASGSTLTLESGHNIDPRNRAVEIAGSSVAAYNGTWTTTGPSGNTMPITGGPVSSCSSNCGRVRIKRTVHVRGSDAPELNGNHLYTVLDDFRVQLDDAVGGTYTGGGVISFDPDYYFQMLRFAAASSRIVVDRCILNGAEWPNRLLFGIVLNGRDSAVVDSWIANVKNWRSVNPRTKLAEYSHDDFYTATATAVEITNGDRKKIHNNYINAIGISIFAQEWNGGDLLEDVTITRNTLHASPQDMAGGPNSTGLYYPKRHHFEMKQGKRFRIEGNIFDGNWSDWTPCGPLLTISPRGAAYTTNQTSDITIRANTFRNSSGGIQMSGTDSMSESSMAYLTQRVRIDGNLFHDIDVRKWSSVPTSVGGPGICGYAIQTLWPVEDVSITQNTAFDMRGLQPQFFSYGYGRSEGVVVRRNLFSHNHDNGAGALTPSGQMPGLLPNISGTIKQSWDQYFRSGSEFRDNVVIPGVRSTLNTGNYDTAGAQNYTKADCEAYYSGLSTVTCMGTASASETANQRIASVKFFNVSSREFRLRVDSALKGGLRAGGLDAGVDIDALESAQGKVRNVRLRPGSGSAQLDYVAPDSKACFVDYGTDPVWVTHTRISDGGGPVSRNVPLTGLNPGTVYYYRVQCAVEQPKGSFVTSR